MISQEHAARPPVWLLVLLVAQIFTLPAAGQIRIESVPSGDVSIDGLPMGTTPLTLLLNRADALVEIRADGYVSWREKVDLSSGEAVVLAVTLQPAQGTLRVEGLPEGATLFAGGEPFENGSIPLHGPSTEVMVRLPGGRRVRARVAAEHRHMRQITFNPDKWTMGALPRSALLPGWGQFRDRGASVEPVLFAGGTILAAAAASVAHVRYGDAIERYYESRKIYWEASNEREAADRRVEMRARHEEALSLHRMRRAMMGAVIGIYLLNLADAAFHHSRAGGLDLHAPPGSLGLRPLVEVSPMTVSLGFSVRL